MASAPRPAARRAAQDWRRMDGRAAGPPGTGPGGAGADRGDPDPPDCAADDPGAADPRRGWWLAVSAGPVTRQADLLIEHDPPEPVVRLRDIRTWRVIAELSPVDGLQLGERLTRRSMAAAAALPPPEPSW